MASDPQEPAFVIPLPGGRVARIPRALVEAHVDPAAESHHDLGVRETHAPELLTFGLSDTTGEWHTDWELGECTYTDDVGNPHTEVIWHRHPLGTEYAEIYRP
jgi:hypothetical protein